MHFTDGLTKCRVIIGAIVFVVSVAHAPAQAQEKDTPMRCDQGPLEKTVGHSVWLTYACADGASVLLWSKPGSPAAPFYFMFFKKGCCYELVGEGNGAKSATAAAYRVLKQFPDAAIRALYQAAKAAKP